MTQGNRRDQATPLAGLGLFVVVLMAFLSLSFRSGNVIAASFRLDDVRICEELDGDLRPVNPGTVLPAEVKQACLWFQYSRAREGDSLEIFWNYGGQAIQKDSYRLSETEGIRAFYLLREDGTALPGGEYSVELFCNGRQRKSERFSVAIASGDEALGNDETLD
jgi:hypothetical protein